MPACLRLRHALLALFALSPQFAVAEDDPRILFFETKIRPLLADNCYNCHSANTNAQGGLRLDDHNGILHGGGRGPALIPGQPEKSLLLQAVRQTHPKLKMPPKKRLTDEEIAHLAKWIRDGAAWPQVRVPASLGKAPPQYAKLRKEHWAWQPLRDVAIPQVKETAWPRCDIDRLLLARLEAKGLRPVADADPAALLRRLTFDLTGLPPTPAELEDLVAACKGASPKKQAVVERIVDYLLASPAFGERWGRHWLDVARYGESTGSARNLPYPHAWRYRDYVLDAFNKDKPFDQFIREQIAGDLLPASTPAERDQHLIATGFLALGVRDVNQRFKIRFVMDNIDEQIDSISRSVLALTVSCARCHDHKFDPIPTTDYYALAGIFASTDLCTGLRNKMGGGGMDYYDPAMLLTLSTSQERKRLEQSKIEETKAALAQAQAELKALVDDPDKAAAGPEREKKLDAVRKQINKIQAQLIDLTDPAAQGPVAYGVRDSISIGDTAIRIRGEAEKIGPTVPRGFLSLFEVPGMSKVDPKQSGRLELAEWLTSPQNPLTARVVVNRVWRHLFGQGLVLSVDNFGVTGDKPSHPELLDYLAKQFIADGWSVKKLVRRIVLSRAYQLSSETSAANLSVDPANRLVWRHNPRRLEAEEIRDAMLAAAGSLNLQRPQGSPAQELKVTELTNTSPLAKKIEAAGLNSTHRSVYLPLLRGLTPRALEVFDFAEQGMVTGSRDTTTVATQALYLLNDPFVRQQALAMAKRVLPDSEADVAARVQMAYRLALSREANAKEIERGLQYVTEYEAEARTVQAPTPRIAAWASFCQALLASAEFRLVK